MENLKLRVWTLTTFLCIEFQRKFCIFFAFMLILCEKFFEGKMDEGKRKVFVVRDFEAIKSLAGQEKCWEITALYAEILNFLGHLWFCSILLLIPHLIDFRNSKSTEKFQFQINLKSWSQNFPGRWPLIPLHDLNLIFFRNSWVILNF